MSIDTRTEEMFPLPVVRKFLPVSSRTGKPVHPSVIFRWIRYGLKARDGGKVHLEALKCGGSLCTSREALDRFFAELTRRASIPVVRNEINSTDLGETSRKLESAGLK
jgi:hypothetical protein